MQENTGMTSARQEGGADRSRFPVRRKLPHGPPPLSVRGSSVQFVTINAAERGGTPFLGVAEAMLDAARFYHERGRWFLRLFLLMPDHLHMLASFPAGESVRAVCSAWKRYVASHCGIRFQTNFFEHRIRSDGELAEKWEYVCNNPVRKGLAAEADEWLF